MIVLENPINISELKSLGAEYYPDMIKAVADVASGRLAFCAEMHSDLERLLLASGSGQENLWGFNIYPDADEDDFIEFDSLINIRPRQKNFSRDVENPEIREKIKALVKSSVER